MAVWLRGRPEGNRSVLNLARVLFGRTQFGAIEKMLLELRIGYREHLNDPPKPVFASSQELSLAGITSVAHICP